MTRTIVEIRHARDSVLFHCPLTGLPVCGDLEQAFEGEISPFLLLAVTTTGDVYARSDDLPEPFCSALQRALEALSGEIHRLDPAMTTEDLETFVPTGLAPLLPDSSVLFRIRAADARGSASEPFWVCMDFTLPLQLPVVEHRVSLEQAE